MRRALIAVLNTLALVFAGLAIAAVFGAAFVTWGWAGVWWAAVPCAVIAAALCVWLGMLAEGVTAGGGRRR